MPSWDALKAAENIKRFCEEFGDELARRATLEVCFFNFDDDGEYGTLAHDPKTMCQNPEELFQFHQIVRRTAVILLADWLLGNFPGRGKSVSLTWQHPDNDDADQRDARSAFSKVP